MQKALEKPCPNCGGKVYVYRYCDQYNEKGQYFQNVYCIQCKNCGQASHTHDNEDDALHEFYVDMDVTPIKQVPVKEVKKMPKWIELHNTEDDYKGEPIMVAVDKIEFMWTVKPNRGHDRGHAFTQIRVEGGFPVNVTETYEQIKEMLCLSGN